ncbi:hypothetical protein [Schlesneria sp.]|uniref:hypothetical protein n=1 Tax=Schlesneria sp. TaxID=2762018 RepID=UPI002F1E7F80
MQEVAPVKNRLGKSAFVLYYTNSSGYYTRARYDEPDPAKLLKGYEALMREGDVLHTGTHPPGLFLAFHALLRICDRSPVLASFLDATQPASFREATDVIAANNLRRRVPIPLVPLDKRVLWLATLLVMVSASLAVVPLFGLLRRTCSPPIAWLGTALWPSLPALAIFIPKSDALFPLVGLVLLWCWLTAWDKRSILLSLISGLVAWLGMLCSLAFIPVLIQAFCLSIVTTFIQQRFRSEDNFIPEDAKHVDLRGSTPFDSRRWLCIATGVLGFVLPTFLMWGFAKVNLLVVWWLNYDNHASFYVQYPRSHWKWLLANPVELTFSSGFPVVFLAASVLSCLRLNEFTGRRRVDVAELDQDERQKRYASATIICTAMVWGLLWLTGKNSGEAARLWLLFLPWLVWLAAIQLERQMHGKMKFMPSDWRVLTLLAIQFAVSLLTVTRVSGFHSDAG